MLTSLLPGLRELRAPLSAGVLWLLAIWFVVEPAVPDAEEASGIVASAYRLTEPLSVFGLGAVLGFVAYLLGSLSVFVFSGRLRTLIPVTTRSRRLCLAGLSPGGDEALRQVARDARIRLEATLSLSGSTVDAVLPKEDGELPSSAATMVPPAAGFGRRRAPGPETLNYWNAPRTSEQRREEALADLVVRDLAVIADAQLLGKENDVFSAVDRDRAELEFRLAVVPALVALALSVGVSLGFRESSPVGGVAVVALGIVAAVGLMLDAARQQRAANDLLLNLLAERDRVRAPSLTRLEVRAAEIADQSPAAVTRWARETDTTVRALIDQLETLARSGLATVPKALDAAVAARHAFDRLQGLLRQFGGAEDRPLDRSVLEDLVAVLGDWITRDPLSWSALPAMGELFPHGLPSEQLGSEEVADRMERARTAFPVLQEEMRRRAFTITARQAAGAGAPAPRGT